VTETIPVVDDSSDDEVEEMTREEPIEASQPKGKEKAKEGDASTEVEVAQEKRSNDNRPTEVEDGADGDVVEVTERSLMEEDWTEEYEKCKAWGGPWREIQDGGWPRGYRLVDGKLVKDGVWCVPMGMTGRVLRTHHTVAGHSGGARL